MRVLVTGGTGVIGEGIIPALLEAGHSVRVLSRGAGKDVKKWPDGVEPFAADVTEPQGLKGAAEECEAVIHVTGIVEESPPRLTYERVNVEGTRNILEEALRAGARRFLYMSSLGSDRGDSDYHRSKLRAEEVVTASETDWLILRPGNVYGPGDEVISSILKLVRASPVVPVVDDGEQRFQPVWYEDLGRAVAAALEKPRLKRRVLELAGTEMTTMSDVVDRLGDITGRSAARVPVPSPLVALGVRVAKAAKLDEVLGMKLPVSDAKLTMLLEENFIEGPRGNALTRTLGIKPTPLDEGLRLLVDMLPEQLPSEGVGSLSRKRYWADIKGSRYTPEGLMKSFRENCSEVMPLEFEAEPGAQQKVSEGATLTLALPVRGNVQVRVEEVSRRRITFSTVEGHMLAGAVQFSSARRGKSLRFTVEVKARAATNFDLLAMNTVGDAAQSSNWEEVVRRVVDLSKGRAPEGVESETEELDEKQAARVEAELELIVNRRKRSEKAQGKKPARKRPAKKSAGSDANNGDALSQTVGALSSLAATAINASANIAKKALRSTNGRKGAAKKRTRKR